MKTHTKLILALFGLVVAYQPLTAKASVIISGVIGDFVWQDLNGDGVQDANEPGKQDVTVELLDCTTSNVLFSTTTDETGFYSFENLISGNYQVKFTAPAGFGFSPRVAAGDFTIDSNPDPATGLDLCRFLGTGQQRLALDAGLVAAAQGAARIGDRVWQDLDDDGRQDAGEPGLEDVQVRLLDCDDNELTTTTTGVGGAYVFPGLAAGQYRIGFVAPLGFAFSPANQGPGGQDSNANPATGLSGCLTMADGQIRLGIDAGMRNVGGSGVIGDFVWHDLDGDGIQDAEEPGLEGVSVGLENCRGDTLASTSTDEGGAYAFENVPPGNYKVHFSTDGSGFSLSPRKQGTMRGQDSNPFQSTGLSQCLSMVAGQTRLGIDAGFVAAKRVFVTSQTYDGNLGGLTGADQKCQMLADIAELTGVYKAWLSDDTGSPATRFNFSPGNYVLVDGQLLASGQADLLDGIINTPINLDENGADVNAGGGAAKTWSNTFADGTFNVPNHCNNWSTNSSTTTNPTPTGDTTSNSGGWANGGGTQPCDSFLRLYCFEQ